MSSFIAPKRFRQITWSHCSALLSLPLCSLELLLHKKRTGIHPSAVWLCFTYNGGIPDDSVVWFHPDPICAVRWFILSSALRVKGPHPYVASLICFPSDFIEQSCSYTNICFFHPWIYGLHFFYLIVVSHFIVYNNPANNSIFSL